MKAAAVAAERGHDVTLYEKQPGLGGQALLAQRLPVTVADSAALGMTNAGLAQMTQIAETITNAGSGIRNAIRIAETGKAELFFPSLAADAAKAVTLFEKLLDTAEVLGSDQSLKDKIKNVAEAAKELRNVVES